MTDKTLLRELKKQVRKYSGKKCKDFNIFCYACLCWLAYDILESLFEDVETVIHNKDVR